MSESSPPIDPSPVMQLSTAYWCAQTLFTANRLGLFTAIAGGCHTVTEIAAACDTHERPLLLLLKACASLGLLEQYNGEYRVSALSQALLVPGQQAYLGDAIRYSDDLYDTWGKLEQAMRDNQPQLPTAEYTGEDTARTRHFVRGMHDRRPVAALFHVLVFHPFAFPVGPLLGLMYVLYVWKMVPEK